MKIIGLQEIKKAPGQLPAIFDYRIDLEKLNYEIKDFTSSKNIIIIGNGGSITSFEAFYRALKPQKEVFVLSTMEPRLIEELRAKYSPQDALVVPISKSGLNLAPIESLLAFVDYPVLAVTTENNGALSVMAQNMNWKIIDHPAIGGRFSAGASPAMAPALLSGLDAQKILSGLYDGYQNLQDQAFSLSNQLFELERKGIDEVYLPIYSYYLTGFHDLIVQLMHESVCKDGKGQTYFAALSPESQHHTNQRLFGGKRNMAAIFLTYLDKNDSTISVPDQLKSVSIRDQKLSFIDKLSYQKALQAEYLGTKGEADNQSIPNFTIQLDNLDETEIGKLVAFWHLMAFYSSILRNVDPFDQPAVEGSKELTIREIADSK